MKASPFLISRRGHKSDDSTNYEVDTEDESYGGYQRAVRGKNVGGEGLPLLPERDGDAYRGLSGHASRLAPYSRSLNQNWQRGTRGEHHFKFNIHYLLIVLLVSNVP